MLARLNQVNGVGSSYANESGSLIRVSLRPGADPARVAAEAGRVLREQAGDRVADRLGERATTAALQKEQWRDASQVAENSAPAARAAQTQSSATPSGAARPVEPAVETTSSETTSPQRYGLLLLLLACAAVGLWLVWRRHRKVAAQKMACNAA